MESITVAISTAIWLGILTSISPCPLATNIAAIGYIGRQVGSPRKVLIAGLLYTFGRMLTYLTLGMLIVAGLLSIPELAMFLQQNMNKILGPILIIVGLVLLDLISITFPGGGLGSSLQGKVESMGVWGAGLLGLLFALSFCPISAALFFGSLIPLALDHQSSVIVPTIYGIGTALPVVAFAVLIALGVRWVGAAFNKISVFERWARKLTAVAFILIGVYYSMIYIFGVNF